MAMREGHIAAATPAAVMWGWTVGETSAGWTGQSLLTGVIAGCAVMLVCTAPDWDHPRFENRTAPLASFSRWYARGMYRIRTKKDRVRADLHRGPTHCVETALLVGLLVGLVLLISPQTRAFALPVGLGVAIGWADHVLIDWCTPSGVPLSMTWNYFRHGEVWRRSTLSRRWLSVPVGTGVGRLLPRKTVVAGQRVKMLPLPCVLPGDERAPSNCDKGWFKTDKGAEHAVIIPGFYALTVLLGLARAGIVGLVLAALTGVA